MSDNRPTCPSLDALARLYSLPGARRVTLTLAPADADSPGPDPTQVQMTVYVHRRDGSAAEATVGLPGETIDRGAGGTDGLIAVTAEQLCALVGLCCDAAQARALQHPPEPAR